MNNIESSSRGKPRRASASPTKKDPIAEEPKVTDGLLDEDNKSTSEDLEMDNFTDDGLQDDEETGLTGGSRGRRKEKKRRNTLLDHRIAGDSTITDEEKKQADQDVFRAGIVNAILIALWYIFSLSISIYNKWMFSEDRLNFHFPLFTTSIPVEGFPALYEGFQILVEAKGKVLGPLLLLFPGVIAFCMTASEFALLQRTSVVTLSIAGIFKEVVTISAAGIVFGDTLTPINISGLFVTIGAIAAYNYIKITKMREDARLEAHKKHIAEHGGGGSGSEADGESESDEEEWNTMEGTMLGIESITGVYGQNESGDGGFGCQ
ncbi:putative Uncharacterized transporter C22E12.01 [Glarea lozoyensis 74030]|uniref:Putative Uncharacterized transporter C22E12.01 n=1 Tax=Glarea lozoyensis (strain ATCC 74030 / MF5533) TaxID=1104152 RepID=H0EFB5_GLAL7|nr:putative Uncharacterized transporter C22E12.01 [Glarea lozoyensis 74030]